MKTYEEMAQSVICRAKAHKAARNRWIAGSVAAVLALCVCIGVAGRRPQDAAMQEQPVTQDTTLQGQPVTQVTQQEPRVTVLYAEGDTTMELEQGIALPSCGELRVVDITGKTDDEIEAIAQAEKKYAEGVVDAHPGAQGYGWEQHNPLPWTSDDHDDHLVVTFIYVGDFVLKTDDVSQVESIRVTTKNSTLILPAFCSEQEKEQRDPFAYPMTRDYSITGELLNQWYYEPYGGIEINMGLGNGIEKYLNKNPVPLSQLSETFTFAVTFTDGTVENHTVDVVFNDNGQIYTLYRGTDAAV